MKSLFIKFIIINLFGFNIYKNNYPQDKVQVDISGIVKDSLNERIPFCLVTAYDQDRIIIDSTRSDLDGVFKFRLNSENTSKLFLIACAPGFLADTLYNLKTGNITIILNEDKFLRNGCGVPTKYSYPKIKK